MGLVNRYENFRFEPYQYREFPKWVKPIDPNTGKPGEPVLVEDKDEERMVMRLAPAKKPETFTHSVDLQPEAPDSLSAENVKTASTVSIDLASLGEETAAVANGGAEAPVDQEASEELTFLRKRATDLGVAFGPSWGVMKIRRAIQKAQDSGLA